MAPSPDAVCANCSAHVTAHYCARCGQRSDVAPLTLGNIVRQVPGERVLLPTLAGLARRPGRTIQAYLAGHRVVFTSPLSLLTLTAGIAALLYTNHDFDLSSLGMGGTADQLASEARWLHVQFKYRALIQLLFLPVIAAVSWLVFVRRGRGYAEHLVINAYAMSVVNVLYVLLFGVLLVADRTPAFALVWTVSTVIAAVYKVAVLYAVFTPGGARWATACLATVATAAAFGVEVATFSAVASHWSIGGG